MVDTLVGTLVETFVAGLTFGESQVLRNLALIPVFGAPEGGPVYISLRQAMQRRGLVIREVSSSGSVPDLLVENAGDDPVMILDGEELLGAKQNRVLNTTVMIPARSKVVVPVSCTERGRWGYSSPVFAESDAMLHHSARVHKSEGVHAALRADGSHRSRQGEVWQDIQTLHMEAHVASPTHAMHDVYVERREQLADIEGAFRLQAGQVGGVFMVDGKVTGLEAVSRPEVYADVHLKLVRSYGLEATLRGGSQATGDDWPAMQAFLDRLVECKWEPFPAVGAGEDLRAEDAGLVGSALLVDKVPVHLALFASVNDAPRRRWVRPEQGAPNPVA
jgi:hypothetical protein